MLLAPTAISAAAAPARVFYVAPSGADENPGTAEAPWATLQHAADTLLPGESVLVRGGTYHENVVLHHGGAPGQPITFAVYPGEVVVLDGGGTLSSAFETDYSDPDPRVSDIAISGFQIEGFTSFGIVGWSSNDRWLLMDLFIRGNGGEGIRLSNSDGTLVENVRLENNEGGFDCTPILPGLDSDPGCTHLHLADVVAQDNGTQGDTGTDAFAVERGADILVERCTASGGPGDGFDFKSDRTTLMGVIAHNTRNNIKLWGSETVLVNALAYDAHADANLVLAAGGSYTISNVTIANMSGTAYLVVVGDPSASGPTPVSIHNSIFYNDNPANEGTLVWFGPEVVAPDLGHNLYFNPYRPDALLCADYAPFAGQCFGADELNARSGPDASSLVADPLFVDAAGKDFRLGAGSPARDAGTSPLGLALPSGDVFGNPRVSGGGIDLGAIEAR